MPPMTPIDYTKVRQRLAGKQGAGYWRSLAELADSPEFRAQSAGEFPGGGEFNDPEQVWNAPISRRKVFRLLGASMALAGVAACRPQSDEKIVPYVRMPEHLVPGQPRYYATTVQVGGYAHGIIAESHEGRPTKLEGNPDHPATLGACDAIAQASVLSLYDPDRSAAVRNEGGESDFGALLADLKKQRERWDNNQGRGLCFLTGTVTSPSERARMAAIRQRWPQARWFTHEPVDRRAVFSASETLFGEPLEPRYRFDRVSTVLSLDADFLQSQPGFLRYAHDFMERRRPRDADTDLARLYVIESTPTVTGAVSDHRQGLSWYRVTAAAGQIARHMGIEVEPPAEDVLPVAWVESWVRVLQSRPGSAVVVPGEQQPAVVHRLAHAMNDRLGAPGSTVEWHRPVAESPLGPTLRDLIRAMEAGEVESLVMLDVNPAYTAPADAAFSEALEDVSWSLHWDGYYDETAALSSWHVPAAHALETWGDARAWDGTASLVQPLIQPLHGGRSALQMLAALESGADTDPLELLRNHWQSAHSDGDFETFWRRSLRDGVIADSVAETVTVELQPDWREDLAVDPPKPEGLILQLRPDPALWDGRYANNGWLQEMPRPVTTLTWHNALAISPSLAEERGLVDGQMVELTAGDRRLRVPALTLPGQPADAVTLNLGFGRTGAGRVASGVGASAYKLRRSDSPWAGPIELRVLDQHRELALIQAHHHIEGRDLIRSASLAEYEANPRFAQEQVHELSLYPEPSPTETEAEHAWGMAIDLSACIGCNGCVTACQAENNIPVVGPEEVARGHDMHWIRVDRYFSGPIDGPRTAFQPVPCMHCENAPCEYVCPVEATLHSEDGLNQMIYQRCVGTRYCSQNCPYKVRRFNWFDYTSAAAAYPAEPAVQNPDVTVRSRGVMEKCTYCVQRISGVRQTAEAEGRPIRDGELKTACQQSCPTHAIVFGDLADKDSEVSRLKSHPLNYTMLAHLNTRPRTTYLAAVRNPNDSLEDDQ